MDGNGRAPKLHDGTGPLSTEQALESWRSAGREVDRQKQSLTTTSTASAAAERSERAAQDSVAATRAAIEAALRAGASAEAAAEAATVTRQEAGFDHADAQASLAAAVSGEEVAHERYRQLQGRAFERYGYGTDAGHEPETSGAGREPEASGAGR